MRYRKWFIRLVVLLSSLFLLSCSKPAQNFSDADSKEGIQSFELYSASIQDTFTIDVSLPDGYAENKANYPVVYMTDGYWHIPLHGMIHSLSSSGCIKDVIVVGIGYPDGYDYETVRCRDLLDGADKFLTFIVEDVIPEVEKRYRTDTGNRTLFGSSLGGYFTLYALLQPEDKNYRIFHNYILASPTFSGTTDGKDPFEMEETLYNREKPITANVFMAVGGLESEELFIKPFLQFSDILRSRGHKALNLICQVIEGKDHGAVPEPALLEGLKIFLNSSN